MLCNFFNVVHLQVLWAEQQIVKKRIKRDLLDVDHDLSDAKYKWNPKFKDPQWPKMWYLVCKLDRLYDWCSLCSD